MLKTIDNTSPTELVNRSFCGRQIDSLSIQYWNKEGNRLVMYMAFAKEAPSGFIPKLTQAKKGGRLLMFHANPDLLPTMKNDFSDRLKPLLDNAMMRITEWRDENGNHLFDYLWFDVNDFESVEIIRRAGFMKIYDKIAYKILER